MSQKLFVGGLAWATTDQSLHDAFSEFGEVSDAKVIMDRDTGRSRGFGFVTFANQADSDRAREEMDGAEPRWSPYQCQRSTRATTTRWRRWRRWRWFPSTRLIQR